MSRKQSDNISQRKSQSAARGGSKESAQSKTRGASKEASSQATPEVSNELQEGRVVKNTGSSYVVRYPDGEVSNCKIKGNFRIKGIRTTNPVAVGDFVEVAPREGDSDFIVNILPRKNYIIRRASNLSKESHILASNIDMAFLVATLREPETSTTFIDRFLATCEAYRIPATLVLNKIDLWDDLDRELADGIEYLYTSLGYQVVRVSAVTGEGIDTFRDMTRDRVSLMAGNSGVGKSTLINCLAPDANLRTGEISDIHHSGMHTTTFSEMVPLPYGGDLIDVPGVRGFGVIDFKAEEVDHFFPEIFEASHQCRFDDCRHTGGVPGCAVEPAVADHRIAESRYASYLSILEEVLDADKYRKAY